MDSHHMNQQLYQLLENKGSGHRKEKFQQVMSYFSLQKFINEGVELNSRQQDMKENLIRLRLNDQETNQLRISDLFDSYDKLYKMLYNTQQKNIKISTIELITILNEQMNKFDQKKFVPLKCLKFIKLQQNLIYDEVLNEELFEEVYNSIFDNCSSISNLSQLSQDNVQVSSQDYQGSSSSYQQFSSTQD